MQITRRKCLSTMTQSALMLSLCSEIGIARRASAAAATTERPPQDGDEKQDAQRTITLNGLCEPEKLGILNDADIRKILKEKYSIEFGEVIPAGTWEVVDDTNKVLTNNKNVTWDFTWTSSVFLNAQLGKQGGNLAGVHEEICFSPIVFYFHKSNVATLASLKHGGDSLLVGPDGHPPAPGKPIDDCKVDLHVLAKLMKDASNSHLLYCAGPATSESGLATVEMLYYGLHNHMDKINKNSENEVKSVLQLLPRTELQNSTLFAMYSFLDDDSWLLMPAYEALMANEKVHDTLGILYPLATVMTNHECIALTPSGERLIKALAHDKDIRKIIYEKYGFRLNPDAGNAMPDDMRKYHMHMDKIDFETLDEWPYEQMNSVEKWWHEVRQNGN